MKILSLSFAALCAALSAAAWAAPTTFEQAKVELRQKVYYDRNQSAFGEIYCGCRWTWVGRSGGRVDLESCGYKVRAQPVRAARTEIEHLVPAHALGHQRQCWQNGGRKNCVATDPVFRRMEADLHNLTVAGGETNSDRSNFRFGVLPSTPKQYGACATRTDFKQRVTEPRDEAKGLISRVNFYMHDRYGLTMSKQQQQLFSAWHRLYPPTDWEIERDRRIAKVMGNNNPYVTGEKTWTIGQRPSGEGLTDARESARPSQQKVSAPKAQVVAKQQVATVPILGNRNSKVYHRAQGCPSYSQVSERNRVAFDTEAQAQAAGYRLAGNCR